MIRAATENKTVRCAIYCRKSHEEGLEQEFNSLDAQREAGEAFVDLAFAFAELESVVRQEADTGAVVPAIFEPAQAFEDDRAGRLFTDVTYDAAHKGFEIYDLRFEIRRRSRAGSVPSGGNRRGKEIGRVAGVWTVTCSAIRAEVQPRKAEVAPCRRR